MTEHGAKDRGWILGFALFLVLFTSLPYLVAAVNQGPDWTFSGFLYGVEDGHSYIAKMLRGAQGEWLFRSPYSTLPQAGALIYLPYLLLGKLFGPGASHGQLVFAFHLFRAVSIVLLCLAIQDFVALFLRGPSQRRLALALATLGGGLGWLLLPGGQTPLDFYSPETFGFLAIFGLPHLVLARALLLWGLVGYLRRIRLGWRTVLLWLALALTHLLTAAIGLLLVGLHLALSSILGLGDSGTRNRSWRHVIWILVGTLPILLFNAFRYLGDAFLQGWALQNRIPSPPPWHYLLAYGLLLLFAIWGARHLYRQDARKASLLFAWALILPFLLYLPLGLQRRFAEGAWLALLVLALAAFEGGVDPKWRWSFLLLAPSTAILLAGSLQVAGNPGSPAFLPSGEVAAFHALSEIAEADQVVLAAYGSGNALPAWAPLRVVIGHGPETVDLAALEPEVAAFFRAPGASRLGQGADFVLVGLRERALAGGSFDPPEGLELVYDGGGYQIYALTASPAE